MSKLIMDRVRRTAGVFWRGPVVLLLVWASGDWFNGHLWRETWEAWR